MINTVLAADIGTSSLKLALINDCGTVFASSRIRFSQSIPFKIRWLEAFKEGYTQLLLQLDMQIAINVCAIVVSGNGPTLVPVSYDFVSNCNDTSVVEPLLWNADISDELSDVQSDDTLSVSKIEKSLFLPRLLYLKKKLSAEWDFMRWIFSGPEYLLWQLSGEAVTILPEKRYESTYWNTEELALYNIEEKKLPPFVAPGTKIGTVRPCLADSLGISQYTAVYTGAPDFIAALVGTNVLSTGFACDRAGTSEGINACTASPLFSGGVRTLPSIIPHLYNASVLLPASGAVFRSFKHNSPYAKMSYDECIRSILAGNPKSEGALLIRNIAEQVKAGILLLKEAGAAFNTLRMCGGQSRNSAWNQYKATLIGMPIEIMQIYDAELLGDAVLAFYGMGIFSSVTEGAEKMVRVSKRFYP